ncbi:bleomycin resistance protein [Tenggerimyces flavus]|uniref:Bleomycin resistance protein n=1 Tax=Tenggerimyces flavus TaxID=1708749 RepID=A0ABV7Y8U7_9ACTN|nr:VOC family protein [Tenggerimyces flavus]MBM7783732.1 catechol 2,3-dioxygenase-like lactoylglutathione lyase family enzyme [Tenggerimyces flavus]
MIENLKKQAKQLLRWHRQGYHPVAQRLRIALPRYASVSDGEILAAPFTLAQAQELLAREHGFDSWAALVAEGNAMSESTTSQATPALVAAYPQLFVRNVTASCAFFAERLGFEVAYKYGDPPFYALVRRGGAALNLRFTDRPVFDRETLVHDSLLAANIPVTGVKELFLEYQAAGVELVQPLRPQPWGTSDFIVADPDGNLLCFAEVA